MAENESLDLRVSQRWLRVLRSICKGDTRDRVSALILQSLQKAWANTQQQLKKHGTSLQQLIDAALDQDDLGRFFRQTKRHDYVRLFQVEQQPFDTPERLMHRVVAASLDRVLDQVREHLFRRGLCPNVGTWKDLREAWLGPIRGEILRFAERLGDRPAIAVRLATVPAAAGLDSSDGMVSLSLVHGDVSPVGARP